MKSIRDTLETTLAIISALPVKVEIALVGGYAAVLHGVERTTLDIDFCIYADTFKTNDTRTFFDLLRERLPERFQARLIEGSKIPDDPFKHDVIFIEDRMEEYMRIDLLVARYTWELDAIRGAEAMGGIPVPVVSKPYLAAMKLRSTGIKDEGDVVALMAIMTEEEKEKTFDLARKIGRDKKLSRILAPTEEEQPETSEDFL